MKNRLEQIDPFEIKSNSGYSLSVPLKLNITTNNQDSVDLWDTIMRRVEKDEDGKLTTVLDIPSTPSSTLAKKIIEFMSDENHIFYAFNGNQPTAKDIYSAANISKSSWGRIMSGELLDLEKGNVFAIALALRLNENQTIELLYSAGFCVNYEHELDAAIMYFIKRRETNVNKIWKALSEFADIKNGLDCFTFRRKKK